MKYTSFHFFTLGFLLLHFALFCILGGKTFAAHPTVLPDLLTIIGLVTGLLSAILVVRGFSHLGREWKSAAKIH